MIKTEQLSLFPLPKIPKIKGGECRICGRKIKFGLIGSGCKRRIRKEIKERQNILKGVFNA